MVTGPGRPNFTPALASVLPPYLFGPAPRPFDAILASPG
jgi:hypothetical protein